MSRGKSASGSIHGVEAGSAGMNSLCGAAKQPEAPQWARSYPSAGVTRAP